MKKYTHGKNGINIINDKGIEEPFISRPSGFTLVKWNKTASFICKNFNTLLPMIESASPDSRFFFVCVDHKNIYEADADHINGPTLAAFIRKELQACGGHYMPEDWQNSILRNVKVKPITVK